MRARPHHARRLSDRAHPGRSRAGVLAARRVPAARVAGPCALALTLASQACFYSPTGVEATLDGTEATTAAASTSASDPGTTPADPSTASTTGEPTTGAATTCGDGLLDPGEACDNGESSNGQGGNVCRADCELNVCGDAYVAAREGCDDGNKINGDGCNAECVSEKCGDGLIDPANEECDDANQIDADACTNKCKLPVCGDGLANADDECDDANQVDTDACTNACKDAVCGDGLVQTGVEACDDGNQVDDDDCSNQCALASCGDGLQTADEECDDGNNADGDGCSAVCKLPACGDGFPDPGEACDDGRDNNDTHVCTSTCALAKCGDGLVFAGTEECDDANQIDADDCRNSCKLNVCGDGVVNKAGDKETCDDGNTAPGDGCSASCIKECGNGVVDPGEECDDQANADLNDSCTPQCNRLRYYVFVTSAKYLTADFGGVDQADMLCNTLANGAKLPGAGNYRAWLSDQRDSAEQRLYYSNNPYIMVNKVKVADDWLDLTDGSLDVAINRTELNMMIGVNPPNCFNADEALVWTGTQADGAALGGDCEGWSSNEMFVSGGTGLCNKKDMAWTQACTTMCDRQARLYCIEQPPP